MFNPSVPPYNAASGGTESTITNYNGTGETWKVHRFNGSGTLTVTINRQSFKVLVVGGGGGGRRHDCNDPGGGGEVKDTTVVIPTGSNSITVGSGGGGGSGGATTTCEIGGFGGGSSIGTVISSLGGTAGGAGGFSQSFTTSTITGTSINLAGSAPVNTNGRWVGEGGGFGSGSGGGGGAFYGYTGAAGVVIVAYRIA